MLKLVVDANVLFSFFRHETTTRELITRFESLKLYSPELAIEELLKYKEVICKKSKLRESEFGGADKKAYFLILPTKFRTEPKNKRFKNTKEYIRIQIE